MATQRLSHHSPSHSALLVILSFSFLDQPTSRNRRAPGPLFPFSPAREPNAKPEIREIPIAPRLPHPSRAS